jgi:hypothetical protein
MAQLDALWTDLASNNAATAYQAICRLRAAPRQAVPLCEQHLKPVLHVDAKRLAQALRNLDSDQFTVREKGYKELESQGEAAEGALRQALTGKVSLEMRMRVGQLLQRLERPSAWRRSRVLEVLENIGNLDARRLLNVLAQGAPQARLTEEAQAALDRLRR